MSHFCEIYILYFVWLVKYNLQNIKYFLVFAVSGLPPSSGHDHNAIVTLKHFS